jgi:hypothetical protein
VIVIFVPVLFVHLLYLIQFNLPRLWQFTQGGAAEAQSLFSAGIILITVLCLILDSDLGTIQYEYSRAEKTKKNTMGVK